MRSRLAPLESVAGATRPPDGSGSLDFSTLFAAHLHEIKNDLFFLLGALDKVVAVHPDPQLAEAQLAGAGIGNKLMRLLTLYQLSLGLHPLERNLYSVRELLEDLEAACRAIAADRAIHVTLHTDPELQHVFDRELLSCALVNALHNALRFARSAVRLLASRNSTGLVIRIIDDGPGPAPTRSVDGSDGHSGLGLYFCGEIAAAHQRDGRRGTVSLEPGLKGGAVWTLCVP